VSTGPVTGTDAAPLYHRVHQGAQSGFTLELTRSLLLHIALTGKGTMSGVEELLACLEESEKLLAPEDRILALVDLSHLDGAPLRAQLRLGKWLLQRRERARRVAIFGGKPIEIAVARTVMKIARMKQVGFYSHEHEARDFLGIPG
jgi:hypothetical protein